MSGNRWSAAELAVLRDNAPAGLVTLCRLLKGRTVSGIRRQCVNRRHTIGRGHIKPWSYREIETLREHAGKGIIVLRAMLPGRSTSSIRHTAKTKGLVIGPSQRANGVNQWRGRIPIPAGADPLVRDLVHLANKNRVTMTEIGNGAGFRRGTISDWRYRGAPSVARLRRALNVIGYTLVVAPLKAGVVA